ncbi:thiamine diphosphate-binding protein [Rozella allomycis CSF55]|uniref:2-hydroxyacyl-CoA lyase n=1 Tax=Rozella allomycis (strain CSF55) TaxID=988480 RepID=A0A4P9YE31_ROZAC|nr:thiamine diphosphate-binding protein [Rozella allomycis CSF55]
MLSGETVICEALKELSINQAFGVPGHPIVQLCNRLSCYGIKYISMRNEQSASYAASVIGYITNNPGVCITVAVGPGLLHALPGIGNSKANKWPMIILSVGVATSQASLGAFQDENQIALVSPIVKWAVRCENVNSWRTLLHQAHYVATKGTPGPVYLEFPADIIQENVTVHNGRLDYLTRENIENELSLGALQSLHNLVETLIKSDGKLLVIIGKGAAYSRSEVVLTEFITRHKIPFISMPMGKGVVSEFNELNMNAARNFAMRSASVILIVGARLNWMLNYGKKFNLKSKIIHFEIDSNEFGNVDMRIGGDIKENFELINKFLDNKRITINEVWLSELKNNCLENAKNVAKIMTRVEESGLMNYHQAFNILNKVVNNDSVVVCEGSNTMDISRLFIKHSKPRKRLDAGTNGAMGVGLGYAIAAALSAPSEAEPVICIQGDSAFGFSAMELETISRYNLKIIAIVLNNSGIYTGRRLNLAGDQPVTTLSKNCRYELIAKAFKG